MVDLMRFITATVPVLVAEAEPLGSEARAAERHGPDRSAPRVKTAAGAASGQTTARTLTDEVRAFVRARCVLDPRVWSYRGELWTAYAAWAGASRCCSDQAQLEAPLLAARVAAIGVTGDIIAGVGLREHWPDESTRTEGRMG